jgi:hypothetical protein
MWLIQHNFEDLEPKHNFHLGLNDCDRNKSEGKYVAPLTIPASLSESPLYLCHLPILEDPELIPMALLSSSAKSLSRAPHIQSLPLPQDRYPAGDTKMFLARM